MGVNTFEHAYPFDPTYGYSREELLQVPAPEIPEDFESFWQEAFRHTLKQEPRPKRSRPRLSPDGWKIQKIHYTSTDNVRIGGWLVTPAEGPIRRGFVIGHGYGGRDAPDLHLPFDESALLFPCSRGISQSPHPPISSDPQWHVLHNIQDRNRYVLKGCVQDTWMGVTVLEMLFPQVKGHIGLLGISFGGGIGAMAAAWDSRIGKAHFNIPTFGNQPLRLELPTVGSGASVRRLHAKEPEVVEETLRYYDAASSASFIGIPVHCACAHFDPMVAPPGQFAVYNSVAAPKELFELQAGHFLYPEMHAEQAELVVELARFFTEL